MKKIAIIGNSDFNSSSSEFEHVCKQLIKHSNDKYVFFEYHSHSNLPKKTIGTRMLSIVDNHQIKKISIPQKGRAFFSILHALCFANILLVEGVTAAWLFPIIRILSRKKIILQIHHTDLKSKKKNTILSNLFSLKETIAFRFCHRAITNHESIQDHIATNYNKFSDLIEHGEDHAERIESTHSDHLHYPFLKYMYAISFYNSESANQAEAVLNAFKQFKNKYLVIIGDWDKDEHSTYIKNKYVGCANIFMLNEVGDKRQLNLIKSNAILFIHTSSLGNSGIPMLEAMNLSLPVLAFDSLENKIITEGKASYFKNVFEIHHYLETMNMEKMRKNAFAMNTIFSKRHNWNFISKKYDAIIYDVINEIYQGTSKLKTIS